MTGLGTTLVGKGLITDAQLAEAETLHREFGHSLGKVLLEKGYLEEKQLVRALAEASGFEFVDLAEINVDPMAVASVPESLCERYKLIPVSIEPDGALVVAMSDPANVFALDDVRVAAKREIIPVVATKADVDEARKRYAALDTDFEALVDDLDFDEQDEELANLTEVTEDSRYVKLVNQLIEQGVRMGASDIHIEPGEKQMRVRYRIDGVLHEQKAHDRRLHQRVVSRLKIMAEVDISERRIPQDGRISMKISGKRIDLRFSTLPTVHGEKVVMRILDTTSVMLELKDLGFEPANEERYEESYRKPYGLILVTGPTGSGKSTTLYATLNVKNQPDVNIVTTEDPVEYRLPGINQVQINNKAGLTFAAALRSILRQDPDIVLVGEMRDSETATIGIEAALTGHLVLSTLHTNDAASAMTRLTEMGVEPFLVASAADCILAQRLARRVCSKCAQLVSLEVPAYIAAGYSEEVAESRPEVARAVGCNACGDTGYKGRMAVHEVLTVTEEIERLTVAHASSEEIARTAIAQGMSTLRDDGLAKVLQGLTTIEEIGRVVV